MDVNYGIPNSIWAARLLSISASLGIEAKL